MKTTVLLLSIFVGLGANAAINKSSKKLAADRSTMSAPQVLEDGDSLAGVRVNQGTDFGGATAIGVSYEYMFHPNFGFNPQVHWATYNSKFAVGPYEGEYDYNVFSLAAQATFHGDLFKTKNLDPYLSGGVGRTFVNSKMKTNVPIDFGAPHADSSSTFLVLYANLRYFVNSSWAMQASLGTGLGTFSLGVDHLF
jgi:hypothetical protein